MSVDLTQYVEGDDILVTYRGRVFSDPTIGTFVRVEQANLNLSAAVTAEHVTPEIKDGQFYMAGRQLYVGSTGGVLYGPLGGLRAPDRHEPTQVALIRGLRPAEVRPVVPA